MMRGFNPIKVICRKCGKKYLKQGRFQKVCENCSNSAYFGKGKQRKERRKFKRLDVITKQNKSLLRALLL